jgi:hypothetical protein
MHGDIPLRAHSLRDTNSGTLELHGVCQANLIFFKTITWDIFSAITNHYEPVLGHPDRTKMVLRPKMTHRSELCPVGDFL